MPVTRRCGATICWRRQRATLHWTVWSRRLGCRALRTEILLLCAGMELDASFATLCARAHRDAARPFPTFGLALAALPDAHWDALTPGAALRTWRLIEPGAGAALVACPLRIDERVLHFLAASRSLTSIWLAT
jgi:hypothetical protein